MVEQYFRYLYTSLWNVTLFYECEGFTGSQMQLLKHLIWF